VAARTKRKLTDFIGPTLDRLLRRPQCAGEMETQMSSTEPVDGNAACEPLVSVIIPVYNRAHLIGRAVSSVLAQSYRNFEIVVVDDGSSDDLAGALAEFAGPRLQCVMHPINRGAAAARNSGVESSNGEFVAFLDSDDVWFADKLTRQVAAMRGQPHEVAGHVCGYDCIKAGYPARRIVPVWNERTFGRHQLFGCTCGPGTTLLCRRTTFAEIGPFDEELRRLEDWDWLLRLAAAGYRLLGSPEICARVEVGPGGAHLDVDAALQRIRARHYSMCASQGPASRRIFEAALHFESAAVAFGDKAYGRATRSVIRSLACYPLRSPTLYWHLIVRSMVAINPLLHRLWAFSSRPAR
jgi:glycosyltransferase involved in cell wall biosynthesis